MIGPLFYLTLSSPIALNFANKQFPPATILMAVRWYAAYKLSYRDIEELLAERGVQVDHATIHRWVLEYAPQLEAAFRNGKKRAVSGSWRMDETYSVPGVQGEHGSLNEPRVYLKYTSAVAGANLCLWLYLVVQAYESERQ